MKYFFHALLIFSFACFTPSSATPCINVVKRAIDALATESDLHLTYDENGAADNSITKNTKQVAHVVRVIIENKKAAIPSLIEHLDDSRLSGAKYHNKRIRVGYIYLDILTNIIKSNSVLVKDCTVTGLGACMKSAYYFRPDENNRQKIRLVKKAWLRAYSSGKISF